MNQSENFSENFVKFAVNRRASLRMSKNDRGLQEAASRANWGATARMLFLADLDPGRSAEVRKLASEALAPSIASYSTDQFQYVLALMLIVSIAEKRTQELYSREFAERCDAISRKYQLKDDEFWKDANVPPEWDLLAREFEQKSLQILSESLREYGQEKIGESIAADGADQLFSILESVRGQFFNMLENAPKPREGMQDRAESSLPESLQPWISREG